MPNLEKHATSLNTQEPRLALDGDLVLRKLQRHGTVSPRGLEVSAGQEEVRGVGDPGLGTDLGTGNILHLSLL
jgi:hypothetical protein